MIRDDDVNGDNAVARPKNFFFGLAVVPSLMFFGSLWEEAGSGSVE